MKTALSILFFSSFLVTSCTKNEPAQNTEPADYAETKEKLIKNPGKDSLQNDSTTVPSAMPPQAPTPENR